MVERKPKAEDTARKTQTKQFMEKVQVIIDKTPQWPIQQIARDLGISHTTVNACVKEDLKCRSYRRQTSQILTEKTKSLRLIKTVRLLNKLKHPKKPNMLGFFSDEKNFCQDQVHNSQNHRWIATNNRDMPRAMKTKFPATVMVFGMVSSEGHIMPPHIFEVGLKVNTKVYLDVLKSVVIPWYNQGGQWQTLGVAAGLGAGPQVQRDPGLASEGVLRLCTLLSLAPLLLRPEPAGLLRLVIRREHHQHDFPQHQSQPDRRQAPAGACRKGMLPVPDQYQGSDWGWRRLHWIDVSSTT